MLSLVVLVMFAAHPVIGELSYKTLCDRRGSKRWEFSVDISVPTCRLPNGDDELEFDEMSDEDFDEFLDLYPGLLTKREHLKDLDIPTTQQRGRVNINQRARVGCQCQVFEEFISPNYIGGRPILHFPERGVFQFIHVRRCSTPGAPCADGGRCVQETKIQYLAVPGSSFRPVTFDPFDIESGCACKNI